METPLVLHHISITMARERVFSTEIRKNINKFPQQFVGIVEK
jgi:hypothetical protein